MNQYISPRYGHVLKEHSLNTFQAYWDLPENWVERPNKRRGGWSGATLHTISGDNGHNCSIFVKRQENHNYLSFGKSCQVRPTFFREFTNMCLLEQIGVPTLEPVYYGERVLNNKRQAVLATAALDNYSNLNTVFEEVPTFTQLTRRVMLHQVADIFLLMHNNLLRHASPSGKHVMVKLNDDDSLDIRIIDLEKMKRSWHRLHGSVMDIERFIRHTPKLSKVEHAEFIRHYVRDFTPIQQKLFINLTNYYILKKSCSKGYAPPLIHLGGLDEAIE